MKCFLKLSDNIPLSTLYTILNLNKVRLRAQQAVESTAFSPASSSTAGMGGAGQAFTPSTVLGTPAERFEAIVFAYQDLVRLLHAFRRFRHRTYYLPKMQALLQRTVKYYQARALLTWKKQWIKTIKHNFSSEEKAWKGFVQGNKIDLFNSN